MSSETDEYPEKYLEGLRLFNEEEFFECHDVLEELWADEASERKRFYQGLIQAAIALFHFGNENLGGARKLYVTSCEYLADYGPAYMGIDLARFRTDMKSCFQELLDAGETYPRDVVLKDELVPKLAAANATDSE